MGKIYNFILNASNGTGADHNKSFMVDWDKMPNDKSYKMSFVFTSNDTGDAFGTVANVYCNLGQTENNFGTSDSMINIRGDYLGFLVPVSYAIAGGFYESLRADRTTNPPIYLDRRPQSSNITVSFNTSVSTTATYTPPTGNYTLFLSFEEL
jgi:hypothetical protein